MKRLLLLILGLAIGWLLMSADGLPASQAVAPARLTIDRCFIQVTVERSYGFANDDHQPERPMQTNTLVAEPLPGAVVIVRDGVGRTLDRGMTDAGGTFASEVDATDPAAVTVEIRHNGESKVAGGLLSPCIFGVHAFFKGG